MPRVGNVARPKQLAHDDALPVAGLERLRRDIGDVASSDHRDGEVRRDRVSIDPLVLDDSDHIFLHTLIVPMFVCMTIHGCISDKDYQ